MKKKSKKSHRLAESPADRVLSAYIAVCRKEGVAGATLQKAARAARVPFATAHYHWGGKSDALLTAALNAVGKRAQAYIGQAVDLASLEGRDPLREYVEGTFRWILEAREDAKFWVYFYYHAANAPSEVSAHQNFIEAARARVRRLIHESIGMGFHSDAVIDQSLSDTIHGLVFGNGVLAITQSGRSEFVTEVRDATWKAVVKLIANRGGFADQPMD